MYRVSFLMKDSSSVAFGEFESFKEAVDFSIQQPNNFIIEIKHYDAQTNNLQNKSNNSR